MPTAVLKRKIAPRVSESTFDKIRVLTGFSLEGMRDADVIVSIDDEVYRVSYDSSGKATVVKLPERPLVPKADDSLSL